MLLSSTDIDVTPTHCPMVRTGLEPRHFPQQGHEVHIVTQSYLQRPQHCHTPYQQQSGSVACSESSPVKIMRTDFLWIHRHTSKITMIRQTSSCWTTLIGEYPCRSSKLSSRRPVCSSGFSHRANWPSCFRSRPGAVVSPCMGAAMGAGADCASSDCIGDSASGTTADVAGAGAAGADATGAGAGAVAGVAGAAGDAAGASAGAAGAGADPAVGVVAWGGAGAG
mmetsp:Transcript_8872/g.21031  ORF Transcript_8872/g.21031 Transcript_8872/m.21031 type:complete len:224 (-) Transcript_8872:410-1081(-)